MPVMRSALLAEQVQASMAPLATASLMMVLPTPAPCSVMPFVMLSRVVQVQVPPGINTLSPAAADPTAALTSVYEQDGATISAPNPGRAKRINAKTTSDDNLNFILL